MPPIKVLLVDDEVSFTASMQKVLSRRGFDVMVASDGLTALPMVAKEHFDVVVLDMKMPGMDGTQVFMEIKRVAPDIRVILLTGHYSLGEEEDILKKGAYAYLLKPYPTLELVKVISSAASDGKMGSNSPAEVEELSGHVKQH